MIDIRKKVGIIGFGNMGSIIVHKLIALPDEYAIWVFEKDRNKAVEMKGVSFSKDIADLVSTVDTLVLAVKPQDIDKLLRELKNYVARNLIISIAAGISTKHIETILPGNRVIRVMPNIAARIGESVTCLCKGHFALEDDLGLAQEMFSYLGVARIIDEDMMNAATAISGSGPGYIFHFIENSSIEAGNISVQALHDMMRRLEKAAEEVGFNLEDAAFLAANTVNASINLLKATGLTPGELKTQVASKGGTTEAGLEILYKGGSWQDAALAALKRANDLANKPDCR